MGSYLTLTDFNSTIESYVTNKNLSDTLSDYALKENLTPYALENNVAASLESYSTTAEIEETMKSALNELFESEDFNPYAKKSDLASSLTVYAKTTDLAKANVATAQKLSKARTIKLLGDAAGSVSFDGSGDVNLNVTVNHSAAAENDSEGNKITSTYATINELNNLAARVPSFSFALEGGILTISDGINSYQFFGTAV